MLDHLAKAIELADIEERVALLEEATRTTVAIEVSCGFSTEWGIRSENVFEPSIAYRRIA